MDDIEAIVEGARQAAVGLIRPGDVAEAVRAGTEAAWLAVLSSRLISDAVYNAVTDHLERHRLDITQ